jgi:hypothetical protein
MAKNIGIWFALAQSLVLAVTCVVCLSSPALAGVKSADSSKGKSVGAASVNQLSGTTTLVQEQAELNCRAVAQNVEEKLWPAFDISKLTYDGPNVIWSDNTHIDDQRFYSFTFGLLLGSLALVAAGIVLFFRIANFIWKLFQVPRLVFQLRRFFDG